MAIYQEVARVLEAEIRAHFRNGDYLPSEARLAERFAINRHTVRRAIDELVNAGMLLRQHGKGTLVVAHALEYRVGARGRFSESIEALGQSPEAAVISRSLLEADDDLARRMGVAPGTPLLLMDTLRSVNGQPVTLITHYLRRDRLPDLDRRYGGGSLHAFIEKVYGIRLWRRQGLISAVMPNNQESLLLKYPRNMPLLRIKSNNVEWGTDEVLEYSISRSRADCFEYKVQPAPPASFGADVPFTSKENDRNEY